MTAKPKPLTQRCWDALLKHGPLTSDALARRLKRPARDVSKAVHKLKLSGRAKMAIKAGEAVFTGVKATANAR